MRIKYHATFFTSSPRTGPISKTVASVFMALQGKGLNLIPNPAQELVMPNPTPIMRPRFVSEDGSQELVILGNRINIVQQSPTLVNSKGLGTFNDFLEFATKCIESIESDLISDASRLAFTINDSEPCNTGKDSVVENFVNLTDFYKQLSPIEWGSRVNALTDLSFGNHKEPVNTMLRVERAIGKSINTDNGSWVDFDRIFKEVEINTQSEREVGRFSRSDFIKFLVASNTTMVAIEKDLGPKLGF